MPDAIFKRDGQFVFVEVDHTQSMAQNEKKVALYRELKDTQIFQKKHGHFPSILFVTVSEYRQKNLLALLDGMKAEVMTFNELK